MSGRISASRHHPPLPNLPTPSWPSLNPGNPRYPVVCAMTSITNLDLGVVGDTAQESLFEAGPLENLSLVCEEVLGLLHQAI